MNTGGIERIEGETDNRLIVLAPQDNVAVVREAISAGEELAVSGRAVTMTPLQYVRCERLFGAHYDLMRAEPGSTVTQIAYDWGFTHLGRFSHDYRAAFGVSPRDQLTGR